MEAQLLGGFREQGLIVTQPFESPDFRIETGRWRRVVSGDSQPALWPTTISTRRRARHRAREGHLSSVPPLCGSPKPSGNSCAALLTVCRTAGQSLHDCRCGLPGTRFDDVEPGASLLPLRHGSRGRGGRWSKAGATFVGLATRKGSSAFPAGLFCQRPVWRTPSAVIF